MDYITPANGIQKLYLSPPPFGGMPAPASARRVSKSEMNFAQADKGDRGGIFSGKRQSSGLRECCVCVSVCVGVLQSV